MLRNSGVLDKKLLYQLKEQFRLVFFGLHQCEAARPSIFTLSTHTARLKPQGAHQYLFEVKPLLRAIRALNREPGLLGPTELR